LAHKLGKLVEIYCLLNSGCYKLACVIIWSLPLCDIVFDFQMLESSLPYIGFTDGARRSTQNLASAAWAIYAPTNELVSSRGVCLGHVTNNIAEYSIVIKLLIDAISLKIHHLVVRLDL
jgi:hypothetical protein